MVKIGTSFRNLRHEWHAKGFAHHEEQGQIKTFLCGVDQVSEEFQSCQSQLDALLNSAYDMQKVMFEELHKIFLESPTKLGLHAMRQIFPENPSDDEIKSGNTLVKNSLEVFNHPSTGEVFESEFLCPDCSKSMIVWEFFRAETKKKNGDFKPFFLFRCPSFTEKHEKCSASIKADLREEDDAKGVKELTFVAAKFSDQAIYGTIYNWFVTKEEFARNRKSYELFPQYRAKFGESIAKQTSKTIASFLSLYFEARRNAQRTSFKNKKLFFENAEKGAKYSEDFLPDWSDNTQYNARVSEYNIWANLENQIGGEYKMLFPLKGIPGFPMMEASKQRKESEFKSLIEFSEVLLPGASEFWTLAPDAIWDRYKVIYGPKAIGTRVMPPKNTRLWNALAEVEHWRSKGFSNGQIFQNLQNFFMKKLQKLSAHFERQTKDRYGRFTDMVTLREAVDVFRTFGVFLLEQFNRNSQDYAAKNALMNEICGNVKGNSLFLHRERKTYEVLGFSGPFQYSGAVLYRKELGGKLRWFLGLNVGQGEQSPKQAKSENADFFGFDDKGRVHPVVFDLNQKFSILIPLAFSKHQAQEFLWNHSRSLLAGKMKINNARIILEEENKGEKKYSIALAMQKLLTTKPNAVWSPKKLLGIDRGEVIPVAAVVVSEDGAKVLKSVFLGEAVSKKQKELAAKKSLSQKNKAILDPSQRTKARKMSDGMLGTLAREVLSLATHHEARIIIEDLHSGFGRKIGKGTLMSLNQYTKILNRLKEKISYEGMDPRNWIVETIKNFTSKTCSSCGFVDAYEFYDELVDQFVDLESLQTLPVHIKLANGKNYELPRSFKYTFWNRKIGRLEIIEVVPIDWIQDVLIKHKIGTKVRRDELRRVFSKLLACRKDQETFVCISCQFRANADEQAALNIARMFLFKNSKEYSRYKKQREKGETQSFARTWMNFYERMIRDSGWESLPV